MKILQIAPLTKPLPPEGYGGTERVVHWLSKALAELGHCVYVATLPGKGPTPYKKIELPLEPVRGNYEKQDYVKACRYLSDHLPEDVEIIHGHSAGNIYRSQQIGSGACEIKKYTDLPLVITIHGNGERLPEDPETALAFISRAQMAAYPTKGKVIYNPIDASEYIFRPKKDNYLLWMAKLDWKEKGLDIAIEIAEKAGQELFVAGPGLNRGIEKKMKGKVKYLGEVEGKEKAEYLASARAFLHTATWAEPFGIAVIEAMVSGTPVLSFHLGAMPEIIQDGKTGFLCRDQESMAKALNRIDQIDPHVCRQWVMDNFDSRKVAGNYVKYYEEMIARQ